MRSRTKGLSVAAVATMFAFAGAGGVALAVPESGGSGNSASDITLTDCVVESSKDISYVEYFVGTESITKDETVDGTTLDLTTVEGIEEIDAIEVKAGTTVEPLDITCAPDTVDDTGAVEGDEDSGEDTGEEGDDTDARGPNANSTATITLTDCLVESTKDISYIEYFADGASLTKDEDIDAQTFDLSTVEGIDALDAIAVKAGTTVESFEDLTCGSTEEAPNEGTGGTEGDVDEDTGDSDDGTDETDGGSDDGTDETDGKAVISLAGCEVQSTKDISYIAYFTDSGSWKDESMNSETYDLETVENIEDVESIEVKSSTTVESFAIDCGDDTTEERAAAGDSAGETDTDSDETETEGADDAEETESEETATDDAETESEETDDAETESEETDDAEETDADEDDEDQEEKEREDS